MGDEQDTNDKTGNMDTGEKKKIQSTSNSPPSASLGHSDNAKKFFCPCCNMGHPTPADLISHIKQFPIKVETFSCHLCMLEFYVKSDLVDHQRLDHQVSAHKTFPCDECDLDFATRSQLKRHKKMHEEITKKLAASGVVLPKLKRPELPPSNEHASDTICPDHDRQSTTNSNCGYQPEKHSPGIHQGEETENSCENKPQEESEAAERNVSIRGPLTRKRSAKMCKSKGKAVSSFCMSLGPEDGEEKVLPPDDNQQDYNLSSCETYDEDAADDPDYYEVKPGRGRPRLTEKGDNPKTSIRLLLKRKATTSDPKVVVQDQRPRKGRERKVKVRGHRQERVRRKRRRVEKKPSPKKPQDDWEEIEVTAHLWNKDGSIQCPECEAICYSLRGLNRHHRFHFRTMERLKCLLCQQEFTDKLSMNRHMSTQHKLRHNKGVDVRSGNQEIRCTEPWCGAVFSSAISLSKHRIRDHGIDKSQLHRCEQCGKVYPGSTELKNHKRMQTDERPFSCTLCPKAYRSSGGLLWHLKTHNRKSHDVLNKYTEIRVTEKGTYSCELCGKEFKSLYGIRLHKENPEKKCSATPGYYGKWKPKPAMCEVCGREFPSKVTLKNHMVTHTGERPHKCRYCEATFRHYKNKFVHEKMHKNQKDFICNVCGKAFYDGTNLKTHMDSHKEVKDLPCQLCGKLFHVEINRRRHEKRCRNFIRCAICSAVFRQQERLRRHLSISHQGVHLSNADFYLAQPIRDCSDPVIRQSLLAAAPSQPLSSPPVKVGGGCSALVVDPLSLCVDRQPLQQLGHC